MVNLRSPSHVLAIISTIAAAILFFVPPPEGFNPQVFQGAALAMFTIGLFATGAMPEALTAMAFFTIAMLVNIGPTNIVFSGFQSAAFWLIFGGFIIGIAVNRTGLGVRIADSVIAKFGTRYHFLIAGLIITGIALAFVMPSTLSRVVLLIPIVVILTERLGYQQGSPEKTGLVLAAACGTWMPAASILPANVPNMVVLGMAESLYGMSFEYGEYFLLHFPVIGLLRAILIFAVIVFLFPSTSKDAADYTMPPDPEKKGQSQLGVILLITLVLWSTDFIHHISPAWIALAAAVICMLPALNLVPMKDFNTMNMGMLVYIAAILSLGPMIDHSGVGALLGHFVLGVLPLEVGSNFSNFISIIGLGAFTGMVSTAPGVGAVLAPLSQDIAVASGFPIKTIMMIHIIGYSLVMLPYQVPPLIIAMQLGKVSLKDGTRVTLTIAVSTFIILMPINYLWWQMLGMFN